MVDDSDDSEDGNQSLSAEEATEQRRLKLISLLQQKHKFHLHTWTKIDESI
jgi:hypothetical protein